MSHVKGSTSQAEETAHLGGTNYEQAQFYHRHAASPDGTAFKAAVKKQNPAYSGEAYLDMTTAYFFPE